LNEVHARRVEGKVALVTGAASGIGEATALLLAAEGARVVAVDLNGEGAARVAQAIRSLGGEALAVTADVSQEAAVAAAVGAAVETFGGLDILHNNAAGTGRFLDRDTEVVDMDLDYWNQALAVTLTSAMLGCKHAIPAMLAHGGGAIVNTASAAGGLGDDARTAYGAAKAGLMTLTRYVATQYGKRGIRCNTLVPGLVLSPSAREYVSGEHMISLRAAMLTPHVGEPGDAAQAVLFLASDESRYITGQALWLDGGVSARSQNAAVAHAFQVARETGGAD